MLVYPRTQASEASTSGPSSLQELYHPLGIPVVPQHSMASQSSKSCCFKRRTRGCRLTQPDRVDSSAASRLPDEIFSQIARYALDNALVNLDEAVASLEKPSFARIEGMTRASRRLRAIALPEWFRLFIVRHVDDWMWAGRLRGMRSWVRHIICPAHALEPPVSSNVLSHFPHLRSASLSLSCDYQFTPFLSSPPLYHSAPAELEPTPGFSYRQPVTSFPPTMSSLTIRSTHGSETPVLRHLGMQCPDLRTLRLGKCTMFDSCTGCSSDGEEGCYGQIADGGQCPFWGTFPFDHDIYFGGENVEAYADELAAELAPLQKLEEISMGVYLTPNAALAEHRLAHYPWRHLETQIADAPLPNPTATTPNPTQIPTSLTPPPVPTTFTPPALAFPFSTSQMAPPPYANPELWSYNCSACRKAYAEPTSIAEHTAGLILAQTLPKLRKIEWASFFETRGNLSEGVKRGTGSHEWRVVRDEVGTVLDLERVNL